MEVRWQKRATLARMSSAALVHTNGFGSALVWGRCEVDGQGVLMTAGRLRCLCDISNCGDLAPGAESGVAGGTVFNGGEAVAAELDVVVDAGVGGQELLGMAR